MMITDWFDSTITTMGCGQVVRRLTLDQEIEGSNPSIPAKLDNRYKDPVL